MHPSPLLAVAASPTAWQQQPCPRWDTHVPPAGSQGCRQMSPSRPPAPVCPDGPGHGQLPSPCRGPPISTGGVSAPFAPSLGDLSPVPVEDVGHKASVGWAQGDNAARVASPLPCAPGSPPVPQCPPLWHQSPRSQSFLPSPFGPAFIFSPWLLSAFLGGSSQGRESICPCLQPPSQGTQPFLSLFPPPMQPGRGVAGGKQGCWSRLGGGGWISPVKLSQRRLLKAAEKEGWVGTAQGPGGCP